MNTSPSLGRAAASGAVFTGASQAVRILLTILTTIVVARLLSPDDYGVLAMVGPVTAFLLFFRNLGLSHAAIQARTLSDQQSNALFWLNMGASAAIMLALIALAPVVGWFYGDPRTAYLTAASSATVLITGSGIQHLALLNRELRFSRLSSIDIASSAILFIATVAAALVIRNYWALWLGQLVSALFTCVLVWRSSTWRPTFRVSFAGSGQLVRFGASITGFNLLNFLNRNLDNVLIGKVWGPTALGLYDRSYRLMMFPVQNVNTPLSRVMLPVLSKLQDDNEQFRRLFMSTLHMILLISIPAITVAAATSDRLVPLLLGERWNDASPIFFWLSLAALLQPVGNVTGWLFITSGRGRALLQWGAFSAITTIIAFSTGVQWGPVGVAAAYFIITALRIPILFVWSVPGSPIRVSDLYRAMAAPCMAAALTWATAIGLREWLSVAPQLVLSMVIGYLCCVACYWVDPGGREALRAFLRIASEKLASSRRRAD